MSSLDNERIQKLLEQGPEAVSKALLNWDLAVLNREKVEADLYATFKLENDKMTSTEIKHLINASKARFEAVTQELMAKSEYTRVSEKHLSNKKIAGLLSSY